MYFFYYFIKDFKYFNVLTSATQQGYEKELPEDDPYRIETCRSASYSV
jgi:hypothetical protein